MDLRDVLFLEAYNYESDTQKRHSYSPYHIIEEAGLEEVYEDWKFEMSKYQVVDIYKYNHDFGIECVKITVDVGGDNNVDLLYFIKADLITISKIYGQDGSPVDVSFDKNAVLDLARKTCKIRHPEWFNPEQKQETKSEQKNPTSCIRR